MTPILSMASTPPFKKTVYSGPKDTTKEFDVSAPGQKIG